MTATLERRLLQLVVLAGGVVPVLGGAWGVLGRLSVAGPDADSQARYLSGLLLAIGLGFWLSLRRIEQRGALVRTLGAIVVVGGLARLAGVARTGLPPAVVLPLAMELVVTPAILLWRERVERRMRAA